MSAPPGLRPDGPDKAGGNVRYVADLPVQDVLDGALVASAVAAGRIAELDVGAALAVPGVVRVFTGSTLPLESTDHWASGTSSPPLAKDAVQWAGQPIALVIGETRHAAREGAFRVRCVVEPAPADTVLTRHEDRAEEVDDWAPSATAVGDVDAGLAAADVVVTGRYQTANRHHAAMEPSVAVARWEEDTLELWTTTQWVHGVRAAVAQALRLPPDRIRVRSEYVGGGFGAKGSVWPHEILAAAAARVVGRPVRIALERADTFTVHGYQPETIQRVTLGARRDGSLTAIRHLSVNATAPSDSYVEHGSAGTRTLYACPNIETSDRIVRLNVPPPTFMRAPHEGPGMAALEIAMDELASAIDMDPLELRLVNYADHDPTTGKPYSSKALRACYRLAAERFGWGRPGPPRSLGEPGVLIGRGMASAVMSSFRFKASARVTLTRDGRAVIETAAHDIGSGIRAVLPVIAAEQLGIAPERVEVRLGDTDLPEAPGTFGSATTMSVGSAVHAAAGQLRRRLDELAGEPGLEPSEYGEVLALRRLDSVSEVARWAPSRSDDGPAMHAWGAVFAEVRVDELLPVPRVTQIVGAYSVGRVINPLTARAQITGGIIWGLGQALLERSPVDAPSGRFVSTALAGYRVPAAADVPDIEVLFADEHDEQASPIGARGVGEIGTIGVAAAIANAVYHATGVRVRQVPIRIEHLLP